MIADDPSIVGPEQRLADRLVEQWDLHVPVQVGKLVARYADVREFDEQNWADAVLHGLGGERTRPMLLLNRARPEWRTRFTLGHELGHLVIPWHKGTIECETGETDPAGTDGVFAPQEREANRFASRLLIPRRFIAGLSGRPVEQLLAALAEANVSAEAGLWGLSANLGPGYLFAMLTTSGQIHRWFGSFGTASRGLAQGTRFDEAALAAGAVEHGRAVHQGHVVAWVRYPDRENLTDDSLDWKPVIIQILEDVVGNQDHKRVWGSVNGVAASANSSLHTDDPGRLAAFMRQRFATRADLSAVCEHELFTTFLHRRARAFTEG